MAFSGKHLMRAAAAIVSVAALALSAACGSGNGSGSASASSDSSDITQQTVTPGKLTIATGDPAYEPWVMNDKPESGEGYEAAVAYAVAEKMGFRCDTATMNADFGRYYGTTDPTQYVTAYGENYVKMNVLQSDVMQNLIDNVKYE